MTVYPSTADALAKAQDYRLNFFNPAQPRNTWWHKYSFSQDFTISVTWGKDDYFFVYANWKPLRLWIADVGDMGWITPQQIKPYKAWIFKYHPDTTLWSTIVNADSPLWTEEAFFTQRKAIKALP